MDESQVSDLLRSIAISSGLSSPASAISQADRIIAFNVLERFKRYDHKSSEGLSAARRVLAVSIELLSRSSHSACLGDTNNIADTHGGSSTSSSSTMVDVTTPTKLYALGCIMDFVATRYYTDALADIDRAALRQSVLAAAKQLIVTEPASSDGRRIVASMGACGILQMEKGLEPKCALNVYLLSLRIVRIATLTQRLDTLLMF
jgi:hypothetical protein